MTTIDSHHDVPHLTTASTKPLHALERRIIEQQVTIETWFRQQWQSTPAPITSSVDLRNSGYKISPVDTNLFPAGFNNLNRDFLPLCIQAAQSVIADLMPACTKVLLVPENHTRNTFYLQSLAVIQEILVKAGFEVRIGSSDPSVTESQQLTAANGQTLLLEPIARRGNRVCIDDFDPCLVILNNDLSDGVPEVLQNLEQQIRPRAQLGWAFRLKSQHFDFFNQVVDEFAKLLDIDPWLIAPSFEVASEVDFVKREGQQGLVDKTEKLLTFIHDKYAEQDVNDKPFVVVKADSGTYGMGVMMVSDANQLLELNRKQRTKMASSKGSQKIDRVIIQEGVTTHEDWQGATAEPVVYMIGQFVVGGFYRVHAKRAKDENLNAPGMHFEPLAFVDACNNPHQELTVDECSNRFYVYGVIARLAALAAAREIDAIKEMS